MLVHSDHKVLGITFKLHISFRKKDTQKLLLTIQGVFTETIAQSKASKIIREITKEHLYLRTKLIITAINTHNL